MYGQFFVKHIRFVGVVRIHPNIGEIFLESNPLAGGC